MSSSPSLPALEPSVLKPLRNPSIVGVRGDGSRVEVTQEGSATNTAAPAFAPTHCVSRQATELCRNSANFRRLSRQRAFSTSSQQQRAWKHRAELHRSAVRGAIDPIYAKNIIP